MRPIVHTLLVTVAACACAGQEGRSKASDDQNDRAVLAALRLDTVFRTVDRDTSRLIWVSRLRHDVEPWKSGPLLSSSPMVQLALVNRDSFPDLFYTVQYEEFIFGRLLLGGRSGVREVFKSSDDACSVPELRDINQDGLPDLIDKQAGALSRDECSGDPYASVCLDAYPTEWLQVWIQRPDGIFQNDSVEARQFYAELANRYSQAARDLRSALDKATGPPARSPRCNASMAASFESMAARARSIAMLR